MKETHESSGLEAFNELPRRRKRPKAKTNRDHGRRKASISRKYNSLVPRSKTAAEGQHCPVLTGTRRSRAGNPPQATFFSLRSMELVIGTARLNEKMAHGGRHPYG
jgi:hypothetical protein